MMKRNRWGSLLMAVLLIAVFAACGGGTQANGGGGAATQTADASGSGDADVFRVGYCNRLDSDVFLKAIVEACKDVIADDQSIEMMFSDCDNDTFKQLDQIDNYIAQKVDMLVVVVNDADAIVPGIEKANGVGIPVVAMSQPANGGDFIFIGTSSYEAGLMQGQYFAEVLPEDAKLLYLKGSDGFAITAERRDGLMEGLSGRPDIQVLAEQSCDYTLDLGMQVTEDWIQAFPGFDAIMAVNDLGALGAVQALKVAGRLDGVMIGGIDALDDALNSIKAGEMTATIKQDPVEHAKTLYEVIGMIQRGETPDAEYMTKMTLVNADNVEEMM